MRKTIQLSVLLAFGLGLTLFSTERQRSRDEYDRRFEKLEPTLHALGHQSAFAPGETVPVIMQFAESNEQDLDPADSPEAHTRAEQRMSARNRAVYDAGGKPERAFSHLPVQAARVSREALDRLARDPRVARISVDHPIQASLDRTTRAVRADLAWADDPIVKGVKGVRGKDVTVAVIDSGVTKGSDGNPDLQHSVTDPKNFLPETADSADRYGHGTHVAGIVVGSGDISKDPRAFPVQYKGIAPDAKTINLKVLDTTIAG